MASRFRHKITFQINKKVSDGRGGYTNNWVDYSANQWGNIYPVSVSKRFFAEKIESPITHIVETRYRPDLRTDMRIEWFETYHEHGLLDTSYLQTEDGGKILQQNEGGIVLDRFKSTRHEYKIIGIKNRLAGNHLGKYRKVNNRYIIIEVQENVPN